MKLQDFQCSEGIPLQEQILTVENLILDEIIIGWMYPILSNGDFRRVSLGNGFIDYV
jgi:hypothetical protein